MASSTVVTLATTSFDKVMDDPRIGELRPQPFQTSSTSSISSQPASIEFQIKYGEKLYSGRYLFEDGELWVASNWGDKFTAAHALTADSLARVVLREIVDEAKARGELA